MIKRFLILTAFCMLMVATPVKSNVALEPTFDRKMAEAELVIIGTVIAAECGGRCVGSTATLSVWRILKGRSGDTINVSTYSPINELDPRCCEVGATYLMFLRRSAEDGRLFSVWGSYGMVRIGGPLRDVRTFPVTE